MDDPTLFVLDKMKEVLEELRVTVESYHLYELKNNITTLPQTLKSADGVILASTVEWYGIGGYMQQFLDACWLYGDKEKISQIYMCPVVMSTTYGEREGELDLRLRGKFWAAVPAAVSAAISQTRRCWRKTRIISALWRRRQRIFIGRSIRKCPVSRRAIKR
jgi:multimeric flavodoxin WrbA